MKTVNNNNNNHRGRKGEREWGSEGIVVMEKQQTQTEAEQKERIQRKATIRQERGEVREEGQMTKQNDHVES